MRELSRVVLILILVCLTACEGEMKNPLPVDNGGGSVPSADQVNTYIDDQLTPELQECRPVDDARKPLKYPSIKSSRWKKDWSKQISRDLDDPDLDELMTVRLKNNEIQDLNCPRFNSMSPENKKRFWIVFMASVSAAESNHGPETYYDESGTYDSFGLLQIDAPNSRAHGCRKYDGTKPDGGKYGRSSGGDMYDPSTNLRCGMYILRNQLRKIGSIISDKKYYWSVLMTTRRGHQRFKKHFLSHIQQVNACREEGEIDSGMQTGENHCTVVNDDRREREVPKETNSTTRNENDESRPDDQQDNDTSDGQLNPAKHCQLQIDSGNHSFEYPLIVSKGRREWKTEWSKQISEDLNDPDLEELMTAKLKSDELQALNCPNFNSMSSNNKKHFWNIFMATMSSTASGHNPQSYYDERGSNDSYGLLMIDAPNSRAHGCRKLDGSKPHGGKSERGSGEDMYEPSTNLRCGMYILRNQIRKSGSLFYRNSYWGMLRTNGHGQEGFKDQFISSIQQIKACRNEGEMDSSTNNEQNQCLTIDDSSRDGEVPAVESENEGMSHSVGGTGTMM